MENCSTGFSNRIETIEEVTSKVLRRLPIERCYLKTLCKENEIDYLEVN